MDSERERAQERRERAAERRRRAGKAKRRGRRKEPAPAALDAVPAESRGPTNPYAPPRADSPAQERRWRKRRPNASKTKRFVNYVLDLGATLVIGTAIGVAIVLLSGSRSLVDDLQLFLSLGVTFVYYAVSEAVFGRTLGKLATGTMVVDEQGHPLTLKTALLRTIVRFIPFDALSFLGDVERGWHDRWSNTRVIDLRESES